MLKLCYLQPKANVHIDTQISIDFQISKMFAKFRCSWHHCHACRPFSSRWRRLTFPNNSKTSAACERSLGLPECVDGPLGVLPLLQVRGRCRGGRRLVGRRRRRLLTFELSAHRAGRNLHRAGPLAETDAGWNGRRRTPVGQRLLLREASRGGGWQHWCLYFGRFRRGGGGRGRRVAARRGRSD